MLTYIDRPYRVRMRRDDPSPNGPTGPKFTLSIELCSPLNKSLHLEMLGKYGAEPLPLMAVAVIAWVFADLPNQSFVKRANGPDLLTSAKSSIASLVEALLHVIDAT